MLYRGMTGLVISLWCAIAFNSVATSVENFFIISTLMSMRVIYLEVPGSQYALKMLDTGCATVGRLLLI